MAQPPAYNRQYDYVTFQASNPTTPLPAAQVHLDLDAIETTLDAVLVNLALIQRDDGALKNLSVHPDSLSAATLALISGWSPEGDWATSTVYAVGDLVNYAGTSYVCLTAHTSGTFATDLAAAKWMATAVQSGISGLTTKSVAGATDVTLTATEEGSLYLKFTGVLTGNINVIVSTTKRLFIVENATTGSFSLTVKTSGGTGVAVTQGAVGYLYGDGTNIVDAFSPKIGREVQAYSANLAEYAAVNPSATGLAIVAAADDVAARSLIALPMDVNTFRIGNNATDATNDIDFFGGHARDRSDTANIVRSSTMVKRLDASWAAGTGNGGLFTGAKANSTGYYCFEIYNPTTGEEDCGFDPSQTAPTLPSGYTLYRVVGYIKTNSAGTIFPFDHRDDHFAYKSTSGAGEVQDLNDSTITATTFEAVTLSVPAYGVAEINYLVLDTAAGVTGLSLALRTKGSTLATYRNANEVFASVTNPQTARGPVRIAVNEDSQIEYAVAAEAGTAQVIIATQGFDMLTRRSPL